MQRYSAEFKYSTTIEIPALLSSVSSGVAEPHPLQHSHAGGSGNREGIHFLNRLIDFTPISQELPPQQFATPLSVACRDTDGAAELRDIASR